MSDWRQDRFEERGEARAGSALADSIDLAVRRIMTAIIVAGALVGVAIWSQDDEAPRYQVTAADGRVYRVNTESGTVIACEGANCAIVLRRGQDLERQRPNKALPAPAAEPAEEAQPAPALPPPEAGSNEAAGE